MTDEQLIKFIWESDKIEGISRMDLSMEVFYAYESFLALKTITIASLKRFVSVIEPGAKLRDRKVRLQAILQQMNGINAYNTHLAYTSLWPFTSCNRRSWPRSMALADERSA